MTALSARARARVDAAMAEAAAEGAAPEGSAPVTPLKTPERREALSPIEASLVNTVGQWRQEQQQRLEAEWQRVLAQSNARVAPVLQAHGVRKGESWDITDDETSPTGLAVVITRAAAGSGDPAPKKPSRQEIRSATRAAKKATKGGR